MPPPEGEGERTSSASAREERRSFRAFYERTAPAIRAYLWRTASDPDVADDVLQETFVRWLSSDPPEMDERETLAYLYRIATNLMVDRWRHADVERRAAETRAVETVERPEPVDLRRDLAAALDRLEPRHRAIVWLAHVEGYPHAEIAEIVGVETASVRVLLFRARNRLARILEEGGFEPRDAK